MDAINVIPKTETHLHLEGAVPFSLLKEAKPNRFIDPPASWARDFKFRDFAHFEGELIAMASVWFTSAERYASAARQIFQNHLAQNVRYVETSFASGCIHGMKHDAVAVLEAIAESIPDGLEVRIFLGIHHDGYNRDTATFIDQLLEHPKLAGLDLHGDETLPLEPWTCELWEKARALGKTTKAHAGEFMGPEFIWRCIDELGVRLIQHGTRCVEDPELVRRLAVDGITLDMCPISNVKLMPGIDWKNHPLPTLLDAGVSLTLSTDDPLSFGNSLTEEYCAVASNFCLGNRELVKIATNGFESRGLKVNGTRLSPSSNSQPV